MKGLESAMRQPDRRVDDPYLTDRREPEKPKKDYHQPLTGGDVPLVELKRRALPAPEEERVVDSLRPPPGLTVSTNDSGRRDRKMSITTSRR
jgi:hypothetical protein